MDKKTPSKPTRTGEDVTSPELPITVYPGQRADSLFHNTREIQETPARPKSGAFTTTGAVQHRSQGQYRETDIDDGDLAENEHAVEGNLSLHRSFSKTMNFNSHDEKAKRAGKMDSQIENTGHTLEHDSGVVVSKDWAYSTGVSESASAEQEKQAERQKTPEEEELPAEVPETPQPPRKRQRMDDE